MFDNESITPAIDQATAQHNAALIRLTREVTPHTLNDPFFCAEEMLGVFVEDGVAYADMTIERWLKDYEPELQTLGKRFYPPLVAINGNIYTGQMKDGLVEPCFYGGSKGRVEDYLGDLHELSTQRMAARKRIYTDPQLDSLVEPRRSEVVREILDLLEYAEIHWEEMTVDEFVRIYSPARLAALMR